MDSGIYYWSVFSFLESLAILVEYMNLDYLYYGNL